MLLGDAERDSMFEQLSRHAAAGRLDVAELERRVEVVATARTREQAAVALADLPPLPASTPPARARPRRGRGHGDADAPEAGWQPTNERFRDPRTDKVMRVWVDAGGGRHYVEDAGS